MFSLVNYKLCHLTVWLIIVKNCKLYNNVKKYIHKRVKDFDPFNINFTTVNNVNTRPKRMDCHDCS